MGNYYSCYCKTCKEYFFLGKEGEFYGDKKLMYCFKDWLISHHGHELTFGGDEWNSAWTIIHYPKEHTWDFIEKGWKSANTKASEEDYENENNVKEL